MDGAHGSSASCGLALSCREGNPELAETLNSCVRFGSENRPSLKAIFDP